MRSFLLKFFVLAAALIVLSAFVLLIINANLAPIPPIAEIEIEAQTNLVRNDKLQTETDSLLPLFDNMPSVPVFVKDEPILTTGTNTERGVAYTNCDKTEFPNIFVKKNFYETANQKQLTNILKHELTHAWLCRQNEMTGHDERFRQKFKEVGGFGN